MYFASIPLESYLFRRCCCCCCCGCRWWQVQDDVQSVFFTACLLWFSLFHFSFSVSLPLRLHVEPLRPSLRRELLQPLSWLLARLCAFLWRCACWIRDRSGSTTLSSTKVRHIVFFMKMGSHYSPFSPPPHRALLARYSHLFLALLFRPSLFFAHFLCPSLVLLLLSSLLRSLVFLTLHPESLFLTLFSVVAAQLLPLLLRSRPQTAPPAALPPSPTWTV